MEAKEVRCKLHWKLQRVFKVVGSLREVATPMGMGNKWQNSKSHLKICVNHMAVIEERLNL